MAPIRVGIIGLGPISSPGYKAGEWGIQHMNAILKSPHYELVAVSNSTIESAERSIKSHKLPSTVKAYGSAKDIASDPNVDLVAIAVRISHHYELVKEVLQQKKKVLIEFPATPDVAQTEELAAIAKSHGIETIIGAQGRADPAIRKLKELVDTKAIGDIVYSSFSGQLVMVVDDGWAQSQAGFLDLNAGISRINIALGHPIDTFIHVLGGFKDIQATFKTSVKATKLFDDQGNVVDPAYKVTAPDMMLLQGVLDGGAVASFNLRTARSTADDVSFRWTITGTKGEVTFTSGPGFFQMGFNGPKILLKNWGSEAQEVGFDVKEAEYYGSISPLGLNTLRLYEAYARGETDGYSNIEQTLRTEGVLDKIKKTAIWAS
ncbi:unnamed protein product [Clonostachys rosea f. rosea IK726]|uniref:Uncharacterized protein n=2 Tax=Bionectria ochroleuca TaxID=29856 RepID=A0A0B7KMJ2_BIOOC|nr:unnamed protein product [Clonostachys rosea f. rosea IK726]